MARVRTRIEKHIFKENEMFRVTMNRASLGGMHSSPKLYTLEEARAYRDNILDNFKKEANTGIDNNACRGGVIDSMHNHRQAKIAIKAKGEFVCERCSKTYSYTKLNLHHKNHDRSDDRPANFEILCTYCHREHHNLRGEKGAFIQRSTTIPNGSTLQVNGSGSGVCDNES